MLEPTIRLDRRSYPRTVFRGPVLVDVQDRWLETRALDVSRSGIRLSCEPTSPLGTCPIGSEVELYFELGATSIEAQARLVRRTASEICLAFAPGRRHIAPPSSHAFDSSN